jgi:hypothetical protein
VFAALNDIAAAVARLGEHQTARFDSIASEMHALGSRLQAIEGSLAAIEAGLQQLPHVLGGMDGHVQALARVIALQTGRLDHMSVVLTEQARFLPSWPWAPETAVRVLSLLSLLKPLGVVGENRIRVGRDGDGGYVMIDDFRDIDGAVSLGVGDDVSWDEQIANYGIEVWQFDPTVLGPPAAHALFHFEPLRAAGQDGEGAICLETILRTRLAGRDGMTLLKIDIEGDEWAVFNATNEDVLARFKQIVCEFHGLDRLGEEEFAGQVRATLEKLSRTHFVYHVHGNNCGNFTNVGNVVVPETLEVSFGLRSAYRTGPNTLRFPTELDRPNQTGRADLFLGAFDYGET